MFLFVVRRCLCSSSSLRRCSSRCSVFSFLSESVSVVGVRI